MSFPPPPFGAVFLFAYLHPDRGAHRACHRSGTNIRSSSNGGNGWTHYGPHDSQFVAINMVGNVGDGWVDGSAAAGQVGNGSGSHIWNMNNYNNIGVGFHTRLGAIGTDIAVSGAASQTSILLDSVAGPSLLSNVTAAGGIGIECKNGSQNIVTGIVVGTATDGLKLNSCANSKFDLVFADNANAINFAVDNGANQIFANVSNGAGQTVSTNIGSMSALGTTLFLHCNSSSTGCFGATTAHKIQFAGSALGSAVAMLDAAGTFTNTQTFASDVYWRNGTNGYTRIVQSGNNALPYMEWRTGTGTRLAYLGTGSSNFDVNLENSASFAVNGFSNGQTLLTLKRATDTSPTGKFQDFLNAANASLWTVDINGSLSAGTVPAARISGAVPTASALAANGANCTANNIPLGVDAAGAVEGCYQLAASGLANGTTGSGNVVLATSPALVTPTLGVPANVNDEATAGIGISYIRGSASATTQAASIAATNLVTSAAAGMYQVCYDVQITRAASTSSSILVTIAWNNGSAQSKASTALNTNVLNAEDGNCFVVSPAAGQNITYATTYASTGGTTMQYSLKVAAERRQ